ncbi:MAG: hypothetical protein HPY59_08750 [Anaerolineae bacterium]|nr:hypothetical protein [Anaerolineae bacterium]
MNYYELEKLMEMRVQEALTEARNDALAREAQIGRQSLARRGLVGLGNLLIAAGQRLAESQNQDITMPAKLQRNCQQG